MKEFHLTMKLRNNLLRSRRVALGLNVREAAEAIGLSSSTYCACETMKINPKRTNGEWTQTALRIAKFYGALVEDLWPTEILGVTEPDASRELSVTEVRGLLSDCEIGRRQLTPDGYVEQQEQTAVVQEAFHVLDSTQQLVIQRRFGLDGEGGATLEEVGQQLGRSKERVRQKEARALRLLRGPSRRALTTDSERTSLGRDSRLLDMLFQLLREVGKEGLSVREMCARLHPLSEHTLLEALRQLRELLSYSTGTERRLMFEDIQQIRRWFLTESADWEVR